MSGKVMNDECPSDVDCIRTATEKQRKWLTKIRIVTTSVHLIIRLTASFVTAAYDGWLPRQRILVTKLKRMLVVPAKFSFLSLNTKTYDGTRFDLYRAISRPIVSCRASVSWFPGTGPDTKSTADEPEPESSVHVDVLYDPSPNATRADVIFVHGLHGSLYNTWKQGLWSHRKQVQNLPLEHRYGLAVGSGAEKDADEGSSRKRYVSVGHSDAEYDQLLENITNLINDIGDTLKDADPGMRPNEEPYSPCWPRDWLPKDCPNVRVIAVNYTTDPFLWRPAWISKRIRSTLPQRSQEMEDLLVQLGVGTRPMVWVGHSKGGLYVKQMLVDARHSGDPRIFNFLSQTKGLMFYSVPHRGSSLANWNIPLIRKSVELMEVKKDCQDVLDLHQKFLKLFEEKFLSAEVFSFVETVMTFMFVTNVRVVSVDSADLGLGSFRGVNIDHREICKPLNRDCFLYKELTNLINRVIGHEPSAMRLLSVGH